MVRIILIFIEDLINGDRTAWTVFAVFAGVFSLFALFWWKIARDMRREDEAMARRRRGNDRNKK
jgi:hypothetical protein